MNESESAASSNPYRAPLHNDAAYTPGDGLVLSEGLHNTLRQTRPWVMFLGILGFVGTGLLLLGGVAMAILTVSIGGRGGMGPGGPPMAAVGALYAILALIYIPPSLYLVRYANRIRDFLTSPSTAGLESALSAQKSFWKFVGIFMLVVMVFYGVIFLASILVGALGAMR